MPDPVEPPTQPPPKPDDARRSVLPATSGASLPENLTHCVECGLPFPGPVTNWDDYFVAVEDASFACQSCAEREGYLADE